MNINRENTILKAVQWAVNIAKDNTHGYSQIDRWSPDYDCSSFIISAWENAGVPVKTNGATYTGNMLSALKKSGFTVVTGINLSSSADLKTGDVLLKKGKHTEMYVGNNIIVGAHSDENGGIRGNKKGDQTGKEISLRNYYNYPWDCVLRFSADDKVISGGGEGKITEVAKAVIRGEYGNGAYRRQKLTQAGYNYKVIQTEVNRLLSL